MRRARGGARRLIAVPPIGARSGKAATPTSAGSTASPTSARGRPGCARGLGWPGCGPAARSCGRPRSRRSRPTTALRDFACWQGQSSSLRVHIQSCTWAVPPGWFVPFAPEERWLVLGGASETDGRGPATAAATRTLIYATAMSQARRRIARALNALRRTSGDALTSPPGAAGGGEDTPESGGRDDPGPWQATVEIAQVGRWLEEFHPHSVVELDYGGLVHLLDDDSLRADQSVAEVSAAISASREGQPDLASVLYQRLRSRWQALESLEAAN